MKIDNNPTDPVIIQNINKTLQFINELEIDFRITSGYRCPELNKAVGGVDSSHHL
ncbi:D-Ala-D-Ala carboxypeptidase family metallohydrolase [Proteiniphilum acetatigenes]|uniref:D-Ala-D-Ala carboxypeptidase family metallohydrolase n=1 Tax=Proteiniphilum acetatigenes TaxID=294710 RepID=UPI0009D9757E|nr:D-Ala-D-Ala carboxypeptidase family metallohydrolase [Proteiniphilum acetatigenes]